MNNIIGGKAMLDVRTLSVSECSKNYDPNEDIPLTNKDYDSNENTPLLKRHMSGISIKRLNEMCNELNISFKKSGMFIYLYTGDNEIIYRYRRKAYNFLYKLAHKK